MKTYTWDILTALDQIEGERSRLQNPTWREQEYNSLMTQIQGAA